MNKLVTGTFLVLALAAGQAVAQSTPGPAPAADAAIDAKFKAADKNKSGTLEGVEVDAFKMSLTKIDTDKDGKVSPAEFAAATKAGVIK